MTPSPHPFAPRDFWRSYCLAGNPNMSFSNRAAHVERLILIANTAEDEEVRQLAVAGCRRLAQAEQGRKAI